MKKLVFGSNAVIKFSLLIPFLQACISLWGLLVLFLLFWGVFVFFTPLCFPVFLFSICVTCSVARVKMHALLDKAC